jgi:hypothetical protein
VVQQCDDKVATMALKIESIERPNGVGHAQRSNGAESVPHSPGDSEREGAGRDTELKLMQNANKELYETLKANRREFELLQAECLVLRRQCAHANEIGESDGLAGNDPASSHVEELMILQPYGRVDDPARNDPASSHMEELIYWRQAVSDRDATIRGQVGLQVPRLCFTFNYHVVAFYFTLSFPAAPLPLSLGGSSPKTLNPKP